MEIKINSRIKGKKGLLVICIFEEDLNKPARNFTEAVKKFIKSCQKTEDFKAQKGKLFSTYLNSPDLPEKMLLVGLGKKKKFAMRSALELGGKIGKAAKGAKKENITLVLPQGADNFAAEFLQGIKMSQYNAEKHKSTKKKKDSSYELKELEIVLEKAGKILKKSLQKTLIICDAVEHVKDLVNSPANIVDSEFLAKDAREIARKNNYKVKILDEKELKKQKWGALLAVNQGSSKEPKCIVLEYFGAGNRREKPVVIVGKGIVFDSGGYNLKPSHHIEDMHQDMAGGAVVLGVFAALNRLQIKKNVVGVIAVAENMVSSKAFRPSDIITTLSGKTVEITNTDAEGRLVLADAITHARTLNPSIIITIATLTGAVMVALGERYSGLITNNVKLRDELEKAGRAVDDLGWPLPLHRDFKKQMESKVADLRNTDTGTSQMAGSSKAAAFLWHFIGKTPWCHIDIAGTAVAEEPKDYEIKGATGAGLRMLLKFLEQT